MKISKLSKDLLDHFLLFKDCEFIQSPKRFDVRKYFKNGAQWNN